MRTLTIAARSMVVVFVLLGALVSYLFARATGAGRTDRDRDALRGRTLARALEQLGATFVKLGQIAATRPDVFPEGITTALSRLHDNVPPAPFDEVEQVLAQELSADARELLASIDPVPVAAASVAQVHRGVLADGREVAVKVQRRRAEAQIERDLAIFTVGARLLDRLPQMRWVSLPGAVERFAAALRAQLDFEVEARNNRRIARNFAGDPRIRVPDLHEALCTRRVLTMEFIDGVKPTEVLEGREELALAGLRCIAQMVFLDGFVHADMHPGNLLLLDSGDLAIFDVGLVKELRKDILEQVVDFTKCLVMGDAKDFVAHIRRFHEYRGEIDWATFEVEVGTFLVHFRKQNVAELELGALITTLLSLGRRYQVRPVADLALVMVAMVTAEGLGKQLNPHANLFEDTAAFLGPLLAAAAATPAATPPSTSAAAP